MQFRAVKGMNDLLPAELRGWQWLERAFARHAGLHGFAEVRTPLLEPTQLFVRSIGEVTDVVQKEMYTFERGDESLSLRPEGTASCARAYLQHSVHTKEPVTRWYYVGPMFRAERPQRGRYRQFHQAGCEVYGDPSPLVDAELVAMLAHFFTELGIAPLEVKVNSVGNAESRARYRESLLAYLVPRAASLSELSRQRLDKNPLRILDSKHPEDQALLGAAPSTVDALVPRDREHFEEVCALLAAFQVPFSVEPRLVRGIDYYTRTVFEVQTTAGNLGAQNTLAAGGRYDTLLAELGGPEWPAVGFALGLERILLAVGEQASRSEPFCVVLPLDQRAAPAAARLARELWNAGNHCEVDGRDASLKSKLRRANAQGAHVVVVLGESELERGVAQVKNLATKSQLECPLADAARVVREQLTTLPETAQNGPPDASESGV